MHFKNWTGSRVAGRSGGSGAGVPPADGEAAGSKWHGLPARGRREAPPPCPPPPFRRRSRRQSYRKKQYGSQRTHNHEA
ncbi:MAG: hypothetical protein LBK99_11990 [Opitutaceae bacterium]|nr:hypothetical protein [Opitutaceae bacterium]